MEIQIVNLVKAIKTHLLRKDGISVCGQAPWSKPVHYFYGTTDEITCERCLNHLNKKGEC